MEEQNHNLTNLAESAESIHANSTIDSVNALFDLQISWPRFAFVVLLVLLIYWGIRLLNNTLEKASLLGGWNKRIYNFTNKVYIMAEPFGFLIIIASFILINPFVYGIMVLIVLLLGYNIIKSYFSGRVLQLNNAFFKGQKIQVNNKEGFIQGIGRTSLRVQTKQGIERYSYVKLFEDGYTQLQGKEIGGIQSLYIDTSEVEGVSLQLIKDKLWESPYLDWSFEPEVVITNKENQFEAKVLLRERDHLEDLKNLITEWGYSCRLKN